MSATMDRHIHDCTGPEQRCVCGFVSPSADPVHTPGPWHPLEDPYEDCIVAANGDHVVCCGHDYDEYGIIPNGADKRLIAAAPDLLQAAREALETLHSAEKLMDCIGAANRLRDAVRKATEIEGRI